jgi:NAD(P)-dependent dehydrogenase (short-subunit alcohol dehydrogenase family)
MTANHPTHLPAADAALSLSGQRALVTGASLGIGAEVARLLGQRGAGVALHHSSHVDEAMGWNGAGRSLLQELRDQGVEALLTDADLREPGRAASAAAAAATALGGVDILVLCASVQVHQPLKDVDAEALGLQMQVNFNATLEFIRAVLPSMIAQGHGRIISLGSVNQVRPQPELPVYAALKAAQHNLILNVAMEYAPVGITANTVSPGLIATPRNAWRRADALEWGRIERHANPMGRAGTAQEVAQLVALLAAPAGAFITGADIPVDGGKSL